MEHHPVQTPLSAPAAQFVRRLRDVAARARVDEQATRLADLVARAEREHRDLESYPDFHRLARFHRDCLALMRRYASLSEAERRSVARVPLVSAFLRSVTSSVNAARQIH